MKKSNILKVFSLSILFFNDMYVCVYAAIHVGACRDQKRASDPPELGLQAIVSSPMWDQTLRVCENGMCS